MGMGVEFPCYGGMSYNSTDYSSDDSMQLMPNQCLHQESYRAHTPTSYHHQGMSSYNRGPKMDHGYGSQHSSYSAGYGMSGHGSNYSSYSAGYGMSGHGSNHGSYSAGYGMSGNHGMSSHSSSSSMYQHGSGRPYGSGGPMTNEMSSHRASFDNGIARGRCRAFDSYTIMTH